MLDEMLDLKGELNAVRDGLYQHIADRISVESEAGLRDIRGRTLVADIQGPLSEQAQDDLQLCFQMAAG